MALLSGVVITPLSPTSVMVSWLSSTPATSQVQYGTTPSLGSSTTLDSTLVTTHAQTLTNLQPATNYDLAVVSKDVKG